METDRAFRQDACWEERDEDKYICRWFVAWRKTGVSEYAGAFAGYAGGGAFLLERFYAVATEDRLSALWVDLKDLISGRDIRWEDCGDEVLDAMEQSLDTVWKWNDHDWWEQTDEVILRIDMKGRLRCEDRMCFHDGQFPRFVRAICEKGGLIAGPSLKPPEAG
jgi:hypothetical protein